MLDMRGVRVRLKRAYEYTYTGKYLELRGLH